ncbi:MAG TPA: nuclear transport factor 2 family protein [Gemmatimonadales bacterium]|nr:nuclear transport factor 2 family protein [Gemmatimonadales bacterium]
MRSIYWGLLTVALGVPLKALPAAGQNRPLDPVVMRGLEDSLWATTREHRAQAFADYLAPTYQGVYADGVHDRLRELATFDDVQNDSYQLNDFIGRPLGPDRFVVTYRATVRGKYRDPRTDAQFQLDGDYWCSSVWERGPARWQMVLHTETKAP